MREAEGREPGAVVLTISDGYLARKKLIRGASQIKLAPRVCVRANFNPVDVTKYTKAVSKPPSPMPRAVATYVTVTRAKVAARASIR